MRRATAPKFLGLLAVTSILSLSLFTGPASAESEVVDISFMFEVNECTGEGVELDGRLHIVTNSEPNENGTFDVKFHTNTMGVEGTGLLTGDRYRFNEGVNIQGEIEVPAGGTGHMVGHEEFIHPGEFGGVVAPGLDDKHVHFNIVVALDEEGQPSTGFIPDFECR
jgi:hypothetical protein